MIRTLVNNILSEKTDNKQKITTVTNLINEAKNPQHLWPNDVLERVYEFVWIDKSTTMSLFVLTALCEYTVRTNDEYAITILGRMKQNIKNLAITDLINQYGV